MYYEDVIVKDFKHNPEIASVKWPIEEKEHKNRQTLALHQKGKPKAIDKNAEKFESTDVMTFIKRHATTRVVRKRVKYRYSSNNQQIHKT